MQAASSSLATNQDLNPESTFVVVDQKSYSIGERGRESKSDDVVVEVSSDEFTSSDDVMSLEGYIQDSEKDEFDDEELEEELDSDDDEDDEEDDEIEEFFEERARIRRDALELKKLAGFYLHPERPIKVDGTASARCFFDRASAGDDAAYEGEEAVERARILAETKALKEMAVTYRHPELPLQIDATACARNYFHRYTAEEAVSFDEAEERAQVLADAVAIKKLAIDYRHPENPVATTDATVFGRNYFMRATAPEQETEEDDMERDDILEDMAEMKRLAAMYRHPEAPVVTEDPAAFGRSYFGRASAPEQESKEEADERVKILEETAALKKTATDFMHPEVPVVSTDSTACGRNYFERASAPEYEEEEDDEERTLIIKEAEALKQLAGFYRHPEVPVTTTDPTACGRNYFSRASAPPQVSDDEEEDERELILEEMAALKKLAGDYMHPERPLEIDATACARNYFTRASAPEQTDEDEEDERDLILAEMAALKKTAIDFMHPERPVEVNSTACARNYFTRASAPEQVDEDEDEEYERIMQDMAALKSLARDYMHPERPVEVDPTACARNYFSRYSAHEDEPEWSDADMQERAKILLEAKKLKDLAVTFHHPELPLVTDATATARSYFSRPSAPEQEAVEDMEERARVVEEAKSLKKLAVAFNHPELPLVTDGTAMARNYFTRPSAPEQEAAEDAMERARILYESKLLKKLAFVYKHPELPVTSHAAARGRNYFNRASAPGVSENIHTVAGDDGHYDHHDDGEEHSHSHHDDYGHFDMDEDAMFADMRQSLVVPGSTTTTAKVVRDKISSDEEGELSRSPSSVMLFTGADPDATPLLPSMR